MSYWAELESYQPLPLCTCGAHDTLATQMEQDKVIHLLAGLKPEYELIKVQILANENVEKKRQRPSSSTQ